jgi:hypothetical protein
MCAGLWPGRAGLRIGDGHPRSEHRTDLDGIRTMRPERVWAVEDLIRIEAFEKKYLCGGIEYRDTQV